MFRTMLILLFALVLATASENPGLSVPKVTNYTESLYKDSKDKTIGTGSPIFSKGEASINKDVNNITEAPKIIYQVMEGQKLLIPVKVDKEMNNTKSNVTVLVNKTTADSLNTTNMMQENVTQPNDKKVDKSTILPQKVNESTLSPLKVDLNETKVEVKINTTKIDVKINATTSKPIVKKPLITIGTEEVEPSSKEIRMNAQKYLPHVLSSTEQLQISSTEKKVEGDRVFPYNDDNVVYNKNYSHSMRQPGFIIPLVVSIFAVPILALIGYQAIRRGKEAWRNRHYKRMDYLIEGLYND